MAAEQGVDGQIPRQGKDDHEQDKSYLQDYVQMESVRSKVSRSLLKASSKTEALADVCRIAVTNGSVRMAWIGRPDASNRIVPIASFGDGRDYLCRVFVSADPSLPESRGPSGTAWREGKSVLLQDYRDPKTAPWQQLAHEFGWKAAAAIPIFQNGSIYAVLTVYKSETHAFDHEALQLFEELALDVGFALERLDLIEAQKRAHEELLERQRESQRLALVTERTDNSVVITDAQGRVEWVNPAFTRVTGYTLDEMRGRTPGSVLQGPETNRETVVFMREKIRGSESFSAEVVNYRKSGTPYVISMDVQPIHNQETGVLENFIAIQRDVTDDKLREEAVRRLAYFDSVTGLPNRTQLLQHVNKHLAECAEANATCCLAFLDLDNFKHINDTLGHTFGDQLLVTLAKRLTENARPGDIYARVGGDEFAILLKDADKATARDAMNELRNLFAEALVIDGRNLTVSFSIGIACFPEDGPDFETLYRLADIAMYRAKKDGRNAFRVYEPSMIERTVRSTVIEADLRKAIKENGLSLSYQPKISLVDFRVIGVEALLRWHHPTYGWIPAMEMVTQAEQSGLMPELGEWVLSSAASQMKTWLDAGLPDTRIAVNLSALQVRQPDFVEMFERTLEQVHLDGHHVTCELTESAALSDSEAAMHVFQALRAQGALIAIDDFGTGFSSLSYLTKFRPHHLKIDKSFVQRIGKSEQDEAIVRAIIDMGQSLQMLTIAEGVENAKQLKFLKDHGCQAVQGYLISPPLTPYDATQWLQMWKDGGARQFSLQVAEGNVNSVTYPI